MTISAAQIAEIRRLSAEPTTTTYSDALITSILEQYPRKDELGTDPYYYQTVGSTATKVTNTAWIPTYDQNAALAQIWMEKAAAVASHFDFKADGGDYTQSQEYVQAMSTARFFLARSSFKTIRAEISPHGSDRPEWIGNLPEPI